ncbi:MAG: hypothetical protein JNL65_02770 [Saprospiraceae bacterium]|nr:hypothetical protein [Saprospiraceae bacterium]
MVWQIYLYTNDVSMSSYKLFGSIGILIGFLGLFSCKLQEPSWDTQLLSPLVKSNLTIHNLLDSDLYKSDSSHLVNLVFSKSLYDLSIDSLINFTDTSARKTFKIDSLSLYSTSVEYPITLGAIARNAGSTGQLILFLQGSTQVIPSIPAISSGAININADTLFTTMTLKDGKLDVRLFNCLPIDITDVKFELKNEANGALVVTGLFPLIPVNAEVSQTFDLAGKTVEGKLVAQLISLSSPGSRGVPVLIDTANSIKATLKVYDLHPVTATAIWPKQNLINSAYYFQLKNLPVELKETRIKSGKARIILYSTLQDSVRFSYSLPGAIKNGVPLKAYKVLDPAPPGGSSRFIRDEDLSGYTWDLSGQNQDSFNLAFNEVIGSVDSTGIMKTFSVEDSIYIELGFLDLRPEYARGYLRDTTLFAGPSLIDLDFFNRIKSGKLLLDQAKLSIDFENKVGVDLEFKLNEFNSINHKNNQSIALSATEINKPIFIPRASDQNGHLPIKATNTSVRLDEKNSNLTDFINNLPDQISYALQLKANPLGNVSQHRDFIYEDEFMNLNMNLELPMVLQSKGLTICDTMEMDLTKGDLSGIQSGNLHAFFNNGFPLDVKAQLFILDQNNAIIDTLLNGANVIAAAKESIPSSNYIPQLSQINIPVDKIKIDRLLNSGKLLLIAVLDTQPVGQGVRIYDTGVLNFQMTADFVYRVE